MLCSSVRQLARLRATRIGVKFPTLSNICLMRNHQHLIGSRKQIIVNSDGLLRLADARHDTAGNK